jgi:hypothetical protein
MIQKKNLHLIFTIKKLYISINDKHKRSIKVLTGFSGREGEWNREYIFGK